MIKANVVRGGEFMEQALLYQPPEQRVMDYLNNNLQHIVSAGQQFTNNFVTNLQGLYNSVYSDAAINASKYLLSQAGMSLSENTIYAVPENMLNKANHLMKQYIMAHPQISENYKRNLVQGYPDTFFDTQPNTFGKDRLDYQSVMSNILQYGKDGEGFVITYSNADDRKELGFPDKMAILDTWHNVQNV